MKNIVFSTKFFVGPLIPLFWILVTSALNCITRVDPSLPCFIVSAQGIPQKVYFKLLKTFPPHFTDASVFLTGADLRLFYGIYNTQIYLIRSEHCPNSVCEDVQTAEKIIILSIEANSVGAMWNNDGSCLLFSHSISCRTVAGI